MSSIEAFKLRDKSQLYTIPGDKPGYYKWWANESELQIILNKLGIPLSEIQPSLERNGHFYCIYVGVAVKESLRDRLNWHVNQINKPSNVKSGTLSTLRQTISSIVGENMLDNQSTNGFIDKLVVEFHPVDLPIKSQEAKEYIKKIESGLLSGEYFYILNIQENRHKFANEYNSKSTLRKLRNAAKNIPSQAEANL